MSEISVRISDADRGVAAARLRDACAEGLLTTDELSHRLELVFAARTAADLEPVLADLPTSEPAPRRLASWWRRAFAFVLDEVVVSATSAALGGLAAAAAGSFWVTYALLLTPLTLVYFTLAHGSRDGQSPGDVVTGIAVRNGEGDRATYGQAFGRTLFLLVCGALFFVGGFLDFLWPLWDVKRQALHDKAAGTIVVRTRE
jgi:uncharacterized RDD family membrane protein YckC